MLYFFTVVNELVINRLAEGLEMYFSRLQYIYLP